MYGYKHYRFSLSIDRDTLLSVYQGAVKRIRVRTDEGMVVDLGANHSGKQVCKNTKIKLELILKITV